MYNIPETGPKFDAYLENAYIVVIIVLCLMTAELSIYMAYYKDVIFGIVSIIVKIGIYFHRFGPDDIILHTYLRTTVITLFCIDVIFSVVTLLHSYKKVFYLKEYQYMQKGMAKGYKRKN